MDRFFLIGVIEGFCSYLIFPISKIKIKIKIKWQIQAKTIPRQDGFSKTWKPLFLHIHIICFNLRVVPVGGLGKGPKIGDSIGDRTQNLWFHKRIKLELELGILEHMVRWPVDFLGHLDDWWSLTWLVFGLHLWFVVTWVFIWLMVTCSSIVGNAWSCDSW